MKTWPGAGILSARTLMHLYLCEQTIKQRIFPISPALPALQGRSPSSATASPHSPHQEQTPRAEIPQDTLQQEKLMDPPGNHPVAEAQELVMPFWAT